MEFFVTCVFFWLGSNCVLVYLKRILRFNFRRKKGFILRKEEKSTFCIISYVWFSLMIVTPYTLATSHFCWSSNYYFAAIWNLYIPCNLVFGYTPWILTECKCYIVPFVVSGEAQAGPALPPGKISLYVLVGSSSNQSLGVGADWRWNLYIPSLVFGRMRECRASSLPSSIAPRNRRTFFSMESQLD